MSMTKPNVREIAAKANVSPATVSNALNGRGGVSKAVAEQIHAIARELGYQSPRQSEPMRRHVRLVVFKTHGLVIMDTMFFVELIEYMQKECERAGVELVITHVNTGSQEDYRQRVREICNDDCCGILLLGTEMHRQELELFRECKSPMVVLDNAFSLEPVNSVVMDNRGAAWLAVKALYDAGHRKIDHITSRIKFHNTDDRLDGFYSALQRVGLSAQDAHVWEVTPSIDGAYQDMKRLLEANARPLPTAFFAANDLMAIGCMRALMEAGYRIPQDVSIMGMDDTAICQACTPQLSTIHVYRRQLATTAVRMLLQGEIAASEGFTKTLVTVKTVMRDSVREI